MGSLRYVIHERPTVHQGAQSRAYSTADNLIRLWNPSGELVQSFKGSPEPVRSLEIIPGHGEFASACNDGWVAGGGRR